MKTGLLKLKYFNQILFWSSNSAGEKKGTMDFYQWHILYRRINRIWKVNYWSYISPYYVCSYSQHGIISLICVLLSTAGFRQVWHVLRFEKWCYTVPAWDSSDLTADSRQCSSIRRKEIDRLELVGRQTILIL